MGNFHRRCYPLWLRVFSVWLACTRESCSSGDHSFQLASTQGSAIPRRFQTSGGRRTCVSVPTSVYSGRVPGKICLHHLLADTIPPGIRSARTSIVSTSSVLVGQILTSLYYNFYSTDCLLLHNPSVGFWK